jgi:pimeloyl-ACP methyl ester carboxylesterase
MTRGFLERPDCRIYYEVTGSGPPIVFAHGLGGNHLSWWQQVPHFRERYTCVTFSHRGFAPSTAPASGPDPAAYADDLAALVDHLGLRDIRIVCQSMGGWTAMEYVLARPDGVRSIVMASTGGTVARDDALFDPPDKLTRWTREMDAKARDLMSRGIHVAGGERMACEQPAQSYLYQAIDALSAGLDKGIVRDRLMTALHRPAEVLRTIKVPVLWATGIEDIVYPPFLSDILAKLMPNGEVHHEMQAGHSVYFERPAAFNKMVDDFFERYR